MTPRRGPTPERLRQASEVRRLRDAGLSYREIAARLDIKETKIRDLINDPDGAKARARKDSYGGTCVDCGGRTTGSNGRDLAPLRCANCAQGRLDSPTERRCVPVRLCDLSLDLRLEGARAANRIEQEQMERIEILLAALYPSTNVYYVSDRARPMLEAAA